MSHGATWEELPERNQKPAGRQPLLESAATQKRSEEDKAQNPSGLRSPTGDSLAEFNQKLVRRGLGFAVHRDQPPQAKIRAKEAVGVEARKWRKLAQLLFSFRAVDFNTSSKWQ